MCIILSCPTNSTEASDAFSLGHKCSAVQCTVLFSLAVRERTTAGFSSVMKVSSAMANLPGLSLQLDTYLSVGV